MSQQASTIAQPLANASNLFSHSISSQEPPQEEHQAPWRSSEADLAVATAAEASEAPGKQASRITSTPQHSASLKRKLSERTGRKERQNSLRHVKNSTEVLRQRSVQTSLGNITPDGGSGGREGRQFTVGNVGNNGMIYLSSER
ncbi:MAG: Guanine nucleotide exchange factor lte1 [Pleopsidium flavum]|nr:MAG: Guanine nucleotide exchange factor lte1 [Pleopsidium flavum]